MRPPPPHALCLDLFPIHPISGPETLSLPSRRYPVHQSRLAHLTLPSSHCAIYDMSPREPRGLRGPESLSHLVVSVVKPSHPQALRLESFPTPPISGLENLSSVSSISDAPKSPYEIPSPRSAHLTLPSSHRPVHDISLANCTVSEVLNFPSPSAKVRWLAGLSPKLTS